MTEVGKPESAFVAEVAREMCRLLHKRTGMHQSKKRERELRELLLSSWFTLKGVNRNDLRAQGWRIMKVRNTKEMARDLFDQMLAEPEGAWTSCSSIDVVMRESVDGRFCIIPVEPDAPRFKIALRIAGDSVKFVRFNGPGTADIEDLQKELIDWLEAKGAQLFFWGGHASAFEARAEAMLLGAEKALQ